MSKVDTDVGAFLTKVLDGVDAVLEEEEEWVTVHDETRTEREEEWETAHPDDDTGEDEEEEEEQKEAEIEEAEVAEMKEEESEMKEEKRKEEEEEEKETAEILPDETTEKPTELEKEEAVKELSESAKEASETEEEFSESAKEESEAEETDTAGELDSLADGVNSSICLDTEGDEDTESQSGQSQISTHSTTLSNNDVSDLQSTMSETDEALLGPGVQIPPGFGKDDLIPVIGYRRQEWLLLRSAAELKAEQILGNGSGDPYRRPPEVHHLLAAHPHSFPVVEVTKAEGFDFLAFRPSHLEPELVEMERRMWEISKGLDHSLIHPIPPERLVAGLPVRVWFEQDNVDGGTWFRGRLNKLRLEKETADVFLVDFGDLESEVELGRLWPLPRSVAAIPPLGFEAVTAIPTPVSPELIWRSEKENFALPTERWCNYADLVLGSDEYKDRARDTIAGIHEAKWKPAVRFRSFVGPKFVVSFINEGVEWGPKEMSLRGVGLVELLEKGPEAMEEFRGKMEAAAEAKRRRKEEIDAELAEHRRKVLASLPPLADPHPSVPRPGAEPKNEDLKPEELYTSDAYGRSQPALEEAERRRRTAESKPAPKSYEVPFVYRKPKSQILPRLWERPAEIAIRAWPQRGDNPVLEDTMLLLLYAESSRRMEFLPLDAYELIQPIEDALNQLINDDSPPLPPNLHQKYNTCAVRDPLVGNRFVRCEIDWANPRDTRGIKIRSVDRGWPLPYIPHSQAHRIKAIPTTAPPVIRDACELAFPAKLAKMCEAAPDEDETAWVRALVPPGTGVVTNCIAYPASKKHLRGPPYRVWLRILQRSRLWMKDLWEEFLDYSIAANIGVRGPERGRSEMEKLIDSPTAIIRQLQRKGKIPMELTQMKPQSAALFDSLSSYQHVRITHVGSCNAVWIQTDSMAAKAKAINSDVTGTMQEELRKARTGLGVPPLYHWELELGKSVVTKFKHDRCFYRAVIVDFHPPKPAKGDREALAALGGLWFPLKVQVRFVDYGNAEWVDAKELYILRPELCFQEACAVGPCRLLEPTAFAPHFDFLSPVYMRYLQFTLIQNGYQFQGRVIPVEDPAPGQPLYHLDLVDKDRIINFNDYWEKFVSGRKTLPNIADVSRA